MPPTGNPLAEATNAAAALRRGLWAVTAVVGVALAAGIGVRVWRDATAPSSPELDLASLDPAIAAAVSRARKAVVGSPRSARAWGELGMVLAAHDLTGEANRCFTQAERLDPREPRWPYHQAVALTLGAPDEALPKLRRAAELRGTADEVVRLRLAELLLLQGHLDEAEEQFNRVLSRSNSHPRARLGLGRLAHSRGDLDKSLTLLGPALTDPRTRKNAHLLLAAVQARRGDGAAAAEARTRADRMPEDPVWPDPFIAEVQQLRTGKQADLGRADDLLRQGRVADAVTLLRRTVQTYPDSDWGWYLLGKALNRQQDWTTSERALRKAAELAPGAPEVQFYLGVALYHQQDYRAAAACFQRATELKPNYDLAHFNLGHCLDLAGDPSGADAAQQTALRCNPDLTAAHTARADLLLRQGRPAEALGHLRQALRLTPDEPRVRKLLAGLVRQVRFMP
jgi:tetratricopeptide (TPR) repeat protein